MTPARAVTLDASPAHASTIGRWVVISTLDQRVFATKEEASTPVAIAALAALAPDLTSVGLAAGGYTVTRKP